MKESRIPDSEMGRVVAEQQATRIRMCARDRKDELRMLRETLKGYETDNEYRRAFAERIKYHIKRMEDGV